METSTARSLGQRLALRLLLAGAAALFGLLGLSHATHADNLHHAALVIQHSSGRMLARCVAFVESQISGFQLVQRSGVEYQAQQFGSMGDAICQLDNEPQPVPSNCFGTGAYWQYFHRTSSGWTQSGVGASSAVVHDGDMDGWRYAASTGQPADLTFASVCEQPASPPAAAPVRPTTVAAARTTNAAPPVTASQPSASATPSTAASLEAMAPRASPSSKTALAVTGATRTRPPPSSTAIWLFLGLGSTFLVALGALNLRRRGP